MCVHSSAAAAAYTRYIPVDMSADPQMLFLVCKGGEIVLAGGGPSLGAAAENPHDTSHCMQRSMPMRLKKCAPPPAAAAYPHYTSVDMPGSFSVASGWCSQRPVLAAVPDSIGAGG